MQTDDIAREIAATASRLGIPLDEAWLPAIRDHVIAIRAASDLVDGFPLPDETDMAPVFEA